MHNIESLARKAINELKLYNLPKRGFLAGGSLANLVWEFASGNKAVINDIDIFQFESIIEKNEVKNDWYDNKKLYYLKKEIKYYEDDYSGFSHTSNNKEFYIINDTENEGIFNYINYSANSTDPQLIINSFDINCTQIGYLIEEDKFYYTKGFEDFINTGELKLTNILSPAHSAIRLFKKSDELNAALDELEIKMCQYVLHRNMTDINRKCFSDKYAKTYKKYEDKLNKYFKLVLSEQLTKFFQEEKGVNIKIYHLDFPQEEKIEINPCDELLMSISSINHIKIFDDDNLNKVYRSEDLIFYIRSIKNSNSLELWNKLHLIFNREDYSDNTEDPNDIELLMRLITYAPETINNFKYLKLSEQIKIMKTLFKKFDYDPIIAISVMEKIKLDPETDLDEDDLLLLELSVRRQIINDTNNKVNKVLYGEPAIVTRYF